MSLLLAPLLLAGAPDAAAVLRSLEDAGRTLRTMRAAFVETKVIVLLDEKTEARGEVLMQIPGRFRWDYRTPQESAMVIKDGRFARYFPKSKQVFRGEAKGEADLLVGFGPGAAALGKRYEVALLPEESVAGRAAHVLELVPRGGGSVFSRIRLWVDQQKAIPVQTRLTEPTGDHTTVRFEGVVINAALAGSAFDLRLPKDVVEVQ
jgi:outer membrane lipoprotein-sorting protein